MKITLGVIGTILILGIILGGNLSQINDWSTAELIGYNSWSIIAIVGGIFMVYYSFKN